MASKTIYCEKCGRKVLESKTDLFFKNDMEKAEKMCKRCSSRKWGEED